VLRRGEEPRAHRHDRISPTSFPESTLWRRRPLTSPPYRDTTWPLTECRRAPRHRGTCRLDLDATPATSTVYPRRYLFPDVLQVPRALRRENDTAPWPPIKFAQGAPLANDCNISMDERDLMIPATNTRTDHWNEEVCDRRPFLDSNSG